MSNISDKNTNVNAIYFKSANWLGLIFYGVLLLFLRNADPMLQPAMYTEDGMWLGMAYTNGWLHTLLNAKDGYFVWGNIFLLGLSSITSELICGSELVCLPRTIAFYSYIIFSLTAAVAFFVTKDTLPVYGRFLLYHLIIFIPLGDSLNEMVGRLSNIGYLMVLWSVLLTFWKSKTHSHKIQYPADIGLIFSAATNPLCIVLIPILAVVSSLHKLREILNPISVDYPDKFKVVE